MLHTLYTYDKPCRADAKKWFQQLHIHECTLLLDSGFIFQEECSYLSQSKTETSSDISFWTSPRGLNTDWCWQGCSRQATSSPLTKQRFGVWRTILSNAGYARPYTPTAIALPSTATEATRSPLPCLARSCGNLDTIRMISQSSRSLAGSRNINFVTLRGGKNIL